MKKSRRLISFLALIMILLTITVTILSTVSFSSQQMSFTVTPTPLIDIMLSQAKTTTDVRNFEKDLLKRLKEVGINEDKVNITATNSTSFSSNTPKAQTIFDNWGRIGMPGQWSYSEGEQCIINAENTDNLTGFYNPDDFTQSYIDLNFDWTTTNSDNDWMGAIIRFNKNEDGTCTTYIFLMSNGLSPWGNNNTDKIQGLYKIVNNNFNYSNVIECQKITKKWVRNEWQNIRIIAEENNIKVYHKNELIIDYTDNSDTQIKQGSYGFVSWSQANSKFKNISAETMNIRSFEEVLRESEWREGAIKAIVNVQDGSSEQLENQETLGELLSRTISDQIHFIGWGTNYNKVAFQNFIKSNNNNGIFIDNTNYTNSINQTAEYIKTLVNNTEVKDNSLILGEEVSINLSPPEIATNTADSNYPNGKWKIDHNFLYYENHIGQYPNSGKYTNDFITKFDRTGKYTITYQDGSIRPSEVYVHRRPVAVIQSTKTGNSVTLQSNSYDLDSYSTANNGITEEKWQYKPTTEANWIQNKLTTLSGNTDYVVQLQVKDYQGVWSNPESIYLTNRIDAKPVAKFEVKNREMSKYDTLEILDASYDPYGGKIVTKQWEVYQERSLLYKGTNPPKKYTQIGNYSMKLIVTNDRGLTSEAYTRSFKIIEDNIAPEIAITPTESNWAESATVNIQISDLGGSNFKQYQYAITDSQSIPTSWSAGIARQTDSITINQEGLNYLHIKATDNAGNTSDDRCVGPFRIDKTVPDINYTGELTSTQIDYVEVDLQASDSYSGIKSFTLDGKNIPNGKHRFTKNGTYKLVATDNTTPSHSTTVNLVIRNIYYNCTAGLEHPIYSSSYDKCPICATYEGLTTTEDTTIYDRQEHQVKYDNPKNAEIIEYYNGSTTKPVKAGTYNYELKVVYENEEYKTNINGTYTILPKELTITDIIAQDKTYNSDNSIVLSGGRLVGIIEGDEVIFSMPYSGTAESKNVGKWKIAIDEITLSGTDASNYTLLQPEYGTITANIYKRLITVKLEGVNKIYDGNKTVNLTQPEVTGIIENDDIKINIPEQGEAESEKAGKWNVIIEPITIEGEDGPNYKIAEIKEEDIQVAILIAKGELKIDCDDKLYDREKVNPYIVENNSTSEVEYIYYKSGTNEEIDRPFDIGTYDVVGHMKTDGNFTEAISNKVTFEIKRPEQPMLKLRTSITKINGAEIKIPKEKYPISYQDEITVEIEIKNLGKGSGYAEKIITKLPDGFELSEDNQINKENGWTKTGEGKVETSKLSLQSNIENEIFPKEENAEPNESIEDEEDKPITEPKTTKQNVKLVLKVTDSTREEKDFIVENQIIQQDKRGDTISYIKDNEQYSKTIEQFELKYIDFEVENRIVEIFEKDLTTGIQTKYDIYQRPKEIVKLDLPPKKVENSELIVVYQIRITNQGNQKGTVQKITEILPKGVTFDITDNPEWSIDNNGNANYTEGITEILPNETRQVKLKLRWKVTEDNLTARTSYAMITAEGELDQKLITSKEVEIEKTNNYDSSEILLSLITGKMIVLWVSIGIICIALLIGGIVLIRKYVIK